MSNLFTFVNQDTAVKRVAASSGGEYAGPCPWCGGEDRFRVWPEHPRSESGRYWCRQCNRSGDGITYLREMHGMSFRDACRALGLDHKVRGAVEASRLY